MRGAMRHLMCHPLRKRIASSKKRGAASSAPHGFSAPFLQLSASPVRESARDRLKAVNEPQTGPSAGRAERRDRPGRNARKRPAADRPSFPRSFRCTTDPLVKDGRRENKAAPKSGD
jgi:hypothetical protein